MLRLIPLTICLFLASAVAAKEVLPQKFSLQGKTLVYDTETEVTGELAEITEEDVSHLRNILKKSPEITELQLNSVGGSVYAGEEIAGLVLEYGLDTLVDGTCISACVDVFLAGERRRMTIGSSIGFHQRNWPSEAVHKYYRSERKRRRWATPFEFGSWIYEDTQSEVYEHLSYMVARGVDPGFAIETLRTDPDGEWYPSRLRLIAAGVLRELKPGEQP
ncbi:MULTISPECIES: COG3904 family protein [unclassified Leisingera]|uniref:COG3904 family protein n=1 Tax=unclassified Leisingera TaxID=2614906 RepID=UPI00057EF1E3|nr:MULTISPECIES: hypothetical protein [unclassified Leisingera]KIC18037.1 hypothetical protein RA21_06320 [Leisingera sp. ANG-DT]KIC27671.1 hypothetical protein RA24_13300 [Leisingera sp. ANG-M6]KIC32711.1 hypothetical protein RA25_09330 [Leisingera sp. ANG-S5]